MALLATNEKAFGYDKKKAEQYQSYFGSTVQEGLRYVAPRDREPTAAKTDSESADDE